MTAPQRIQLRRTKGWRKPAGTLVVARPGRWGNPWVMTPDEPLERHPTWKVRNPSTGEVLGRYYEREARWWVIAKFWDHARATPGYREEAERDLAGRDLACWCPLDQPCHADVLLELANGPTA